MSFRAGGQPSRPAFRNAADEWWKRDKLSRLGNALYPHEGI
jgi:hypothetical protein